jgi:hypothetical protein
VASGAWSDITPDLKALAGPAIGVRKVGARLRLAVRPMRRSKQPPEQTYRYPQKQDDHREGCQGRGHGEK